MFQDKHAWDILKNEEAWAKNENFVETCKQKTSTQSNVSKRSRINEAGNYSSSTNPETPTSGDIGCSGFPYSADSNKSKGKSKMMNVPSESFPQWLNTLQHMNLARQTKAEVEMEKIKYHREKEARQA